MSTDRNLATLTCQNVEMLKMSKSEVMMTLTDRFIFVHKEERLEKHEVWGQIADRCKSSKN